VVPRRGRYWWGKAPASEGGRYKGKQVHLKVDATWVASAAAVGAGVFAVQLFDVELGGG